MVRAVDMTLDAADAVRLGRFWKTAVGYVDEPPPAPFTSREEWVASYGEPFGADGVNGAWLIDPNGIAPRLSILPVPEPKTAKNRLHLDLRVSGTGTPDERWAEVRTEVDRLLAAGASLVAEHERHHVVLADPEGNEFCVA